MKQMGTLETMVINSPLRAPFARREVAQYMEMAPLPKGARVLEVGCGSGIMTREIMAALKPAHVSAFDYSDEQVELARQHLSGASTPLDLREADAAMMPYADASFDCVFVNGILHHIPRWRDAVREVERVLKPGGVLCSSEFTGSKLQTPLFRIFPHPPEARFERRELVDTFRANGFQFIDVKSTLLYCIVATLKKPAAPAAAG